MSNIGVYGVLCTANGKWYVGQTMNLHKRKLAHMTSLATGKHPIDEMRSDFVRYGASCFEFHVLAETHPDNLLHEESVWIKRKNSANPDCGYNTSTGACRINDIPVVNASTEPLGRHFYQGVPVLVDFETFERNRRNVA